MAKAAADIIMSTSALYRLMAWLSPSYPIGAFAYSHGIEWAVEDERITDVDTLTDWIDGLLRHGGGWSDAVAFCHAYEAAADTDALTDLNAFIVALAPSEERHLETVAQGSAFLKTTVDAWPWNNCDAVRNALDGSVAYPIAVATASAGHGIAKDAALNAFLHGIAATLVSAGVRLIPLGQTDGQRALAQLEETVHDVTASAPVVALSDIGGITMLSDIAAMRHETQYTRLFRS